MGVSLVVFSQIDLECIFKKGLCVPLRIKFYLAGWPRDNNSFETSQKGLKFRGGLEKSIKCLKFGDSSPGIELVTRPSSTCLD